MEKKGTLDRVLWALWVAALLLLFLAGCKNTGFQEQTSNPEIQIELLFEKDGYKIHRFRDGTSYVYYVVPAGQAVWNKNDKAKTPMAVLTADQTR